MSYGFSVSGSFSKTERWLRDLADGRVFDQLEPYARAGVSALSAATPAESSETANSWSYKIEKTGTSWTIAWTNSKMAGATPLVVLLQYGHGTGTGGYVQGRDFINPAIQPIFDDIQSAVDKAVRAR